MPDAGVPEVDAAEAAAAPIPQPTTGVEVVEFVGINPDKLDTAGQTWIAWVEQHFNKCEMDGPVDAVTTTATVDFKNDGIVFELPNVPAPIAACIETNIRTPYLGYEPTPPASLKKTKIQVKLQIGTKAAPYTGRVVYGASKVTGKRDKKALNKWLDANVAQQLKPCLDETPVVQDVWKVSFEIDAAGTMSKTSAPGDANVATCVQKVLDGLKAPGAKGSNNVELVFMIPK